MLLGAALLAFAVSSAFATKAANHQRQTTVFYIDSVTGDCMSTTTNQNCPVGISGCTQFVDSNNPNAQLYLTDDNGTCEQPLQRSGS
ncbi:MAG: hypothetical protein EPN39_00230 [Chitinophagaceae bacterium]|nr:MAG: hypothetical protein EPN39_00230 [Chitinophagaceae bacterium]